MLFSWFNYRIIYLLFRTIFGVNQGYIHLIEAQNQSITKRNESIIRTIIQNGFLKNKANRSFMGHQMPLRQLLHLHQLHAWRGRTCLTGRILWPVSPAGPARCRNWRSCKSLFARSRRCKIENTMVRKIKALIHHLITFRIYSKGSFGW